MNRVLSALDHLIFFLMTIAVAGAITASMATSSEEPPDVIANKILFAHHFCEDVKEVLEEHSEEGYLSHDEVDNIIDRCYRDDLDSYS